MSELYNCHETFFLITLAWNSQIIKHLTLCLPYVKHYWGYRKVDGKLSDSDKLSIVFGKQGLSINLANRGESSACMHQKCLFIVPKPCSYHLSHPAYILCLFYYVLVTRAGSLWNFFQGLFLHTGVLCAHKLPSGCSNPLPLQYFV